MFRVTIAKLANLIVSGWYFLSYVCKEIIKGDFLQLLLVWIDLILWACTMCTISIFPYWLIGFYLACWPVKLVGRSLLGGLGNNLSGLSSTSHEMASSNFLSQVRVKLIAAHFFFFFLGDLYLLSSDVMKYSKQLV